MSGRNSAQFGAKWRQIGTSGALREKCSESTPQKSMIAHFLVYHTSSYEHWFVFYDRRRNLEHFGAKRRKNRYFLRILPPPV